MLGCTEESLSLIYRKLAIGTGKVSFSGGNNLTVNGLMNGKKSMNGRFDETKRLNC
jgi:hypothetical protein